MKIKFEYATQDEVPAEFASLYEERDGKFVLTGVEGMRPEAEFQRVHSALTKERNDHRATKGKFAVLGDRDINEVLSDLDRIEEYKLAADAGKDEHKIEKLVETRLRTKTAPMERELAQLRTQKTELETQVAGYQTADRNRTVRDALSSAVTKGKVIPEAHEDVVQLALGVFELSEDGTVVTRDNLPGVLPGLSPEVWLNDNQSKKPHWFGVSQGGGSGGSRNGNGFGENPFSAEHWNMSKQGELVRSDRAKAEQMARAAGTSIGGPRPEPRK